MASTTIHIPTSLLEIVDARAREIGISRNRLILNALERFIEQDQAWSPSFLKELRQPLTPADAAALENTMREVKRKRSSKPAVVL